MTMEFYSMQTNVASSTVVLTLIFMTFVVNNVDSTENVTPTWSVAINDNSSHLCNLATDGQKTVFAGDTVEICQAKLITYNTTGALLQIAVVISPNTFLYAERKGDLLNCQNRYTVIADVGYCIHLFRHTEIQLFLHGNTTIFINEISVNRSASTCSNQNDDQIEVNPAASQTKYCQIKEFNRSVSCNHFSDNSCYFYDFPHNCDAALNDIEVIFQCYDDSISSNYTALLIYPIGAVLLDLTVQNIVGISGSPFGRVRNLKTLVLDYNKLSYLDPQTLKDLSTLTFLSLSGNRLAALHVQLFAQLSMLQTLYLDDNSIESLQLGIFQNLRSLRALYLDENNLIFLHKDLFSNLTKLTRLSIASNMIFNIATDLFKDLPNLTSLYLHKNQVISLDTYIFSTTRYIIRLDLAYNNLTILPRQLFKGLNKLDRLFLNDNEITSLDRDTFTETPMLNILNLAHNALTYLPSELFNGLSNLEYLFLNNNKITLLGVNLVNDNMKLMWLVLHRNSLSLLPYELFHGLNLLHVVHLERNHILSFGEGMFKNTTNLYTLNLAKNVLSNLPDEFLKGLTKLDNLDLHGNQIYYLKAGLFQDTLNLHSLVLDDNKLAMLPDGLFQKLTKLRILSLRRNRLTSLPSTIFASLTSLESLFLQDNYMTTIHHHILHGLKGLRHLNLSNAYIDILDFDLFQDIRKLELLDVSGNKLQSIPNINKLNQLTFINLQDNPLTTVTNETFSNISKHAYMIVSQPEICECYVSRDVSCNALDDISPYLTCSRLLSDRILVVVMWIIGLNALCGNIFVLSYRKVKHDQKKIQTFLLSNLAMSDLLMGVYMLLIASADIYFGEYFPMQAENWRSGITCKVAGTISIVSSEASVFFLTLISIDRFINIKYPYSDRKLRKKSSAILASILWFTSLALGIVPSSLGGNNRYVSFYDNSHVCIGLPLALTKSYSINLDKRSIFSGRDIWHVFFICNISWPQLHLLLGHITMLYRDCKGCIQVVEVCRN